jgi:3-methyladenine DNA glycosylase/8-oxoguanine DNA glycosylase
MCGMPQHFSIESPGDFSFFHTINSHGWSDLRPFVLNQIDGTITYTFAEKNRPVEAVISESVGTINIALSRSIVNVKPVKQSIRHILRLDEEFSEFYGSLAGQPQLSWIADSRAGRLLRSPTVWEDLVKTMCTTNCSWGLTKNMVTNLVEKLGHSGVVFPTAEAIGVGR